MSYYGTLPTHTHEEEQEITWRHKLGEYLEDQKFHIGILCLTLVDAASVFIQIIYTFFHECHAPFNNIHDNTHWLIVAFEMAEVISVCICVLFILEITLSLIAFGPRYFLPGWPHWKLHVFDAAVVITTFVLEIVLKGKEREVAGLLIIFRLWRVVKVIEAVVLSMSFTHQEELEKLKERNEELQEKLKQVEQRNRELEQQVGQN
ncbi:hypothetical protein CU097_015003 [Rhizopus azygosporus]|uniref:Hydrogen voltage-gated channel 1 n=1 Tax=Rhizopus azygosporus TaxID=86630 RepID=A0A367KG76_RHIAZ|nr:hypothetical protein CU097_015003 [Rhizopus azygosporus]